MNRQDPARTSISVLSSNQTGGQARRDSRPDCAFTTNTTNTLLRCLMDFCPQLCAKHYAVEEVIIYPPWKGSDWRSQADIYIYTYLRLRILLVPLITTLPLSLAPSPPPLF